MTARRFVVPDIHGCGNTFRQLVEEVIGLRRSDTLYLLGDLIDRGPRSKELLDFIILLRDKGYRILSVRGNHEEMLLDSCRDRNSFRLWMMNGGTATLESFQVEDACDIPVHYRKYLMELPHWIALQDFVLVHAGLNFDREDPFSDTEAMLWVRSTTVDRRRIGNRRVICGHTPRRMDDIRQSLAADLITLDNGCVYGCSAGGGFLTALELKSMTLFTQQNIDL